MGIASDGKWLSVEPRGLPVVEAAEEILSLRLADVEEALAEAAREHEQDDEFVHQLRVSCRRAAAALRAFRPLIRRRGKKLNRWLKRLRRAAGPARDLDVISDRLRHELDTSAEPAQHVVGKMQKTRAQAQAALQAVDAKAASGKLKRAIKKSLKALHKSKGRCREQTFADFARLALADAAEELLAVDAHGASLDELHRLRIAAKRLRYSIELFHSAVDSRLRLQAYPVVEELQDRLGAVNDRVAAQALFQGWLAEMEPDPTAAYVASLVAAESAAAERLKREFLAWWLPEKHDELADCLDDVLP